MAHLRWTHKEKELLIEKYATSTTMELEEIFTRHSRKSIERQIEQLRKSGLIGYRDSKTKHRAYEQRVRSKSKRSTLKKGLKRNSRVFDVDYRYEEVEDE